MPWRCRKSPRSEGSYLRERLRALLIGLPLWQLYVGLLSSSGVVGNGGSPTCSELMFPSRPGNREQNMLLRCNDAAGRAWLDPAKFDIKTFRSTYSTRMLRAGFDVRTLQNWMGHKSLETTMRYLAPATEVHDRLDLVRLPETIPERKGPAAEGPKVLKATPKAKSVKPR